MKKAIIYKNCDVFKSILSIKKLWVLEFIQEERVEFKLGPIKETPCTLYAPIKLYFPTSSEAIYFAESTHVNYTFLGG